jgi:hypothetical protein
MIEPYPISLARMANKKTTHHLVRKFRSIPSITLHHRWFSALRAVFTQTYRNYKPSVS